MPQTATLPEHLSPQLATSAQVAPDGDDWLHEIKTDGYRLLCRKDGDRVRLYTRNGHDWTRRLRQIARAVAELPLDRCWFDGELIVLDEEGRSDFLGLQRALGRGSKSPLVFQVWDLMYADGENLTREPLIERKERLREVIATGRERVIYAQHEIGNGAEVHARADALDLEGIVSKRLKSFYHPGKRTRDWRKVKVWRVYDVEIVGVELDAGDGRVSSILLGERSSEGTLAYAGRLELGIPRMEQLVESLKGSSAPAPWPEMEKRGRCWLPVPVPVKVQAIPRRRGEPLRHATLAR